MTSGRAHLTWRWRFAALLITGLFLALLPGIAPAASLPGPASFSTGLVDDQAFKDPSASTRDLWLRRARAEGATAVRMGVPWNAIAPYNTPKHFHASDPGDRQYQWGHLDAAIRSATAHHERVVLVVGRAPRWAEGAHRLPGVEPGAWEPDPRALAQFAHALALRYSGHYRDRQHRGTVLPLVNQFQAWNEPNLPYYLMPQWGRTASGAIIALSPGIYRAMLNAFYAAVKAVQPHSIVLAAGTAPYGDPPGVGRMQPVVFERGLFCLTAALRAAACPDPPHLDALDHHPYAVNPTHPANSPGDVSVPDLGRLTRVLRAAQRVGHVLPRGPKPQWVTEIDWSTDSVGVTQAVQAQYLAEAFYELWLQGVSHVFWFQLRDPPGETDIFAGAGLYTVDGVAKTGAAAFRFPFVAVPGVPRKHTLIIWGRAPAAGTVTIERQVHGRWRRLLALRTTAGGVFYRELRMRPGGLYRARGAGALSVPWHNP